MIAVGLGLLAWIVLLGCIVRVVKHTDSSTAWLIGSGAFILLMGLALHITPTQLQNIIATYQIFT